MIRLILPFSVSLILVSINTQACTTFVIQKDGQMVFGRNYDWMADPGIVVVNKRNIRKQGRVLGDGVPAKWISKYGSITFNQYGREFPMGGINEAGLVIELMWLEGTDYGPTDSRKEVGDLQWIQYQLDNAQNIDEVIASDEGLKISGHQWSSPLHFLIADTNGNVATIEFLKGNMVVHQNETLPNAVLTNSPYSETISYKPINGDQIGTNFKANSEGRFTLACKMIDDYNSSTKGVSISDYAFQILDQVKQDQFTKWSIVYDLTNKTIAFKTLNYQQIKRFQIDTFDFSCGSDVLVLNMNQELSGNVASKFIPYNYDINRSIIDQTFKIVDKEKVVTPKIRHEMAVFPETLGCSS